MKENIIRVIFKPYDLAHSEVWWIRGYWKTICKLWKELKGTELKELNETNIHDFLELNMKTIFFTIGGKND